jgi:tyrosine-protein phosphatase SIW14
MPPAPLTRTSAGALFALTVLIPLAAAPVASGHGDAKSTTIERASIGIDNFGRISASYYRGAQPDERDFADLAAMGIKTVINLTSDDALADEPDMVEDAGMKYVAIPMTTRVAPTPEQLTHFLSIVNNPANQPVYVHCVGGKHRTGVMTAVYRMTHEAWTADQAFDEMKRFKFGADFLHPEFKKFVYAYRTPATPAPAAVLALEAQD